MALTPSLLARLTQDFPTITFASGDDFMWSPEHATVWYNDTAEHADALVLHELSHGLLEHHEYSRDVELLRMETDAWEKAASLAKDYTLTLHTDVVQDHLDTYRDWLHARSTCPSCEATGFQVAGSDYQCPACFHTWRVNEARLCGLKRYSQI